MGLPRARGLPCPYGGDDADHWPTRVVALEPGPDATPDHAATAPHRFLICANCYKEQFARMYPDEPVPDVSRVKLLGRVEFTDEELTARAVAFNAAE